METKETKLRKIFKFERIATILGFIVDTITIISILLAIRLPEMSNITIPVFITPTLALGIWFIGFFVYLSLLHSYWEKNQTEKNYSTNFFGFLFRDLIIKFRSPFVLLPGFAMFVIFLFIIFDKYFTNVWITIGSIIGFIIFVAIGISMSNQSSKESDYINATNKIEEEWKTVEKKIQIEMKRWYWVSIEEFQDIAELWSIDCSYFSYALAKYAKEHPEKTKYAYVYSYPTNDKEGALVSGPECVLVNLSTLPERYYCQGEKY